MIISQKCQYALRAMFELAKNNREMMKIGQIAKSQAIPERFLENILHQLKQSGFVNAKRGKGGGYFLAKEPKEINVGDIVRFIEGHVLSVACTDQKAGIGCRFDKDCVFFPVWEEARKALNNIYNKISLEELIKRDQERLKCLAPTYSI